MIYNNLELFILFVVTKVNYYILNNVKIYFFIKIREI